METLKCTTCDKDLPIENFSRNKTKKRGYNYSCKSCQKEYKDNHYRQNKSIYYDKNKKQKEKYRQLINDYKTDRGCSECGDNHPAILEFHHRDSVEKDFTIADAVRLHGIKKILKEIEKCDVLCSNCHKKLHWTERQNGV